MPSYDRATEPVRQGRCVISGCRGRLCRGVGGGLYSKKPAICPLFWNRDCEKQVYQACTGCIAAPPPKKKVYRPGGKGSRTETKRLRKREKTDKIRDLRPKTALFGVKLFGIVGIVVYLQRKNDNP